MNNCKKSLLLLASAGMLLSLYGCGSSSSSSSSSDLSVPDIVGYTEKSGAAADSAINSYADASSLSAGTANSQTAVTGEKIVYTGSVSIESLNYDDSAKALQADITKYNGIIESETENDGNTVWYTEGTEQDKSRTLYLSVRIPTESFQAFMDGTGDLGNVTSKSSNADNITKQYSDNSVEIEALKKEEDRLLAMMDQAKTIDEMVTVESRLSDVETELNQKQSYQSSMDTDVKYSTVQVTLNEVKKYSPAENKMQTSGFWQSVKDTFTWAWSFLVWLLQRIVLTIIAFLPVGIVAFVIYLAVRKIMKKNKAKKALKHAPAKPTAVKPAETVKPASEKPSEKKADENPHIG
jgi:large-conductance mechanosensitive channel